MYSWVNEPRPLPYMHPHSGTPPAPKRPHTARDMNNTANTPFETIDLNPDLEKQQHPALHTASAQVGEPSARRGTARRYFSSAAWWQEEYWYAIACVATAACLVLLLQSYDGRAVPTLGWGLQLDTAIIAMVTIVRVSMKGFVEAALSQGAWIWVSERAQRRRGRYNARLSDFRVFDEASRGLWGSLCLLWKMRLRHLGCIGAAIVVLIHGFETFSQQMVMFEQRPQQVANGTYSPASAPPRSEV
ncbi:hypothetical protein B0T25DRAFT_573695 [Lasiosphaeria hispida]|uniref:Uncharacterized protein n=1 Tax=Lasiosphaeria hispida TaxID=260671 RepID=A0AAJ0H614_9PEZI|nr:hypothetical protein B0T25DRAFT_573695 [Lasiosphaeria hispida]